MRVAKLDGAGNVEPTHNLEVPVDKTPPQVDVTVSPAPATDGSYRGPVILTFTARDDLSGVQEITLSILTGALEIKATHGFSYWGQRYHRRRPRPWMP